MNTDVDVCRNNCSNADVSNAIAFATIHWHITHKMVDLLLHSPITFCIQYFCVMYYDIVNVVVVVGGRIG